MEVSSHPDMNYIFFRGVPKMIQLADDIHQMTDYIMDLRNMTIGAISFSFLGALLFLFLRCIQKRSGNNRSKQIIMAEQLQDLKSDEQHCSTYRSYSNPWHSSGMKTSAINMKKQHSASTSHTVTANACAENISRIVSAGSVSTPLQFKDKGSVSTSIPPNCSDELYSFFHEWRSYF